MCLCSSAAAAVSPYLAPASIYVCYGAFTARTPSPKTTPATLVARSHVSTYNNSPLLIAASAAVVTAAKSAFAKTAAADTFARHQPAVTSASLQAGTHGNLPTDSHLLPPNGPSSNTRPAATKQVLGAFVG